MTRIEARPRRRRWIAVPTIAGICLLAISAYAFGGRHERHRGEFREYMLDKLLDQADATDEQRRQITAIMQTAHEDVASGREGSREEVHARVLEILTAETIDPAALDALRAEHQQQMDRKLDRMSEALVEAANLLSPEQRVAIAEAMRERFEQHHGQHGPGH